jgi:hypothetical protein
MPLPDFDPAGNLPPGIHSASLREAEARFGAGSEARRRQAGLLRQVVAAASAYPTIKRVLLWGSFVTAKAEPADLDYSLVVSVLHARARVAAEHRRFLAPLEARQYYGVDKSYLIVKDYPLEEYIERLEFICQNRDYVPCGAVEISLRGETTEAGP